MSRGDMLWRQDIDGLIGRPAYVESPDLYGNTPQVPIGFGEDRAYLDCDEALAMATALIVSVRAGLAYSMEPGVRRRLEIQLDGISEAAAEALRWRTTPRKVEDTDG